MQRFSKNFEESPLRSFYSLEANLKRERRVFTIVIFLLACAAIAASAIAIAARMSETLRAQEQIAEASEQDVVDTVLQHRSALLTANMVLDLRVNGVSTERRSHIQERCVASLPGAAPVPLLRESCDEAAQLLSTSGRPPSVAMMLLDSSAAYGYEFSSRLPPVHPAQPGASTSSLVQMVLNRYGAHGLDPLTAARQKRVVWLATPGSADGTPPQMIGASLVARGDEVYAVVLTSMDLADVLKSSSGELPEPIAIDDGGNPLVAPSLATEARLIDSRLSHLQDGRFHWVQGYGWALRRPPLIPGFGHLIHVLPVQQQMYAMRYDLLLIVSVTAALIVLLLAMYRYWNFRFLTRTYSEASRALESEMLNYLLVHATPIGLCIVRKENLEILVANQIARNVLGLQQTDRLLPGSLHREFDMYHKDVSGNKGTQIFQFPFSLPRHGESGVHLEFTYAPVTLNKEEVFFCAIADMTEHHRAEQLLLEAKRTAEATAKAKVNFFASMSHEIRTPLSSLVGNIELVTRGKLEPEQRARVRAMQVSAEGLLQVVNDVLDFSKIDIGELSLHEEDASLIDLLSRIATSYAPLATEQGLKFFIVVDRAIPAVLRFDPIRISQIVNNLLSNAFKFTQSGKIVLRANWADSEVVLAIIDSGIGIPDELKARLFQPFIQGDSNRLTQARGTGLGLSICARLCELMGGRISLDSAVGVGTRISVALPLQDVSQPGRRTSWTLPTKHPVIVCRAAEYSEWLLNLIDLDVAVPVVVNDIQQPLEQVQFDVVIATDEFDLASIANWCRKPCAIVWATQTGPLVPTVNRDGSVEVGIHSAAGMKAAVRICTSASRGAMRDHVYSESDVAGPSGSFENLNVLIAEDNVLNRDLLRDQLTTLGARVVEATNGEEALSRLGKADIDLVLTDIDMPILNGFEFLDEIRKRGIDLPVYAISASARPEDIAEGRARGFTDYLTKPVPMSVLTAVLERGRSVAVEAAEPVETSASEDLDDSLPAYPYVPPSYAASFVEQVGVDLERFELAVTERDTTLLRRCLHGVAGGLAVLGPSQLLEHCSDLRLFVAETGRWTEDIEEQCLAIADELRKMRAMLEAKSP